MKRVAISGLKLAEFNLRWARLSAEERRLILDWLRAARHRRTWCFSSGQPVVIGA